MATWQQMSDSEPEFAAKMRRFLEARIHKTIATLRVDGSPRISGIETFFAGDDLWIGSMPNALKARDLQRDPRCALHSGSIDPPDWEGDAKLTGRAQEVTDLDQRLALFRSRGADPPSPESHLFRIEIQEASVVGLNVARDRLVIEAWRPGQPVRRIERGS
jgi:Pyridoxamine 5'-phosphate oxidase